MIHIDLYLLNKTIDIYVVGSVDNHFGSLKKKRKNFQGFKNVLCWSKLLLKNGKRHKNESDKFVLASFLDRFLTYILGRVKLWKGKRSLKKHLVFLHLGILKLVENLGNKRPEKEPNEGISLVVGTKCLFTVVSSNNEN